MSQSLDIGVRALQIHTRAMEVTSHNIANAATPGFSRQRADLTTTEPLSVTPGQLGRGVELDAVVRITDELLVERLRAAQADSNRFATLAKTLVDVELVFNEPSDTGLSSVLDATFAALEDLSNNPELSSLRAGTVQNLRTFTGTLNNLGERLRLQAEDLEQVISDEVIQANLLIENIVDLNVDIARQVSLGRNPNDLMDRRDVLIKELSTLVDANVRFEPNSKAALIEIAGRSVVSQTNGVPLAVENFGNAQPIVVMADSREIVRVQGGTIGAYVEMGQEVMPAVRDQLDELTLRLAHELNRLHSVGTSHLSSISTHLSDNRFDFTFADSNLDDREGYLQAANGVVGVPEPFFADFTDGNGTYVPRNFSINMVDPVTGVADKFVVRYDPGTAPAPTSRSLRDLVTAINTGRGGGFSVEPSHAGGVAGLRARLISVDGGVRIELQSRNGQYVDFAPANDNRPTDNAWTGDPLHVNGNDLALGHGRLIFEINGGNVEAFTQDPVNGNRIAYGAPAALGGGPVVIGGFTVDDLGGANWTDGQSFSVDLDQAGNIIGGPHLEQTDWVGTDAGFQIRGRYTGGHSFDPNNPWTMRVVQGGTIGSDTNAPIVEFTYFTGPDDGRVQERLSVVLDGSKPAGSQVAVTDGIYVVFDDGDLSTGGTGADMVIDGAGDQAGVLAMLGFNTLFSGFSAEGIQVHDRILDDPNQLAVARTRSPGDNTNVLEMAGVRQRAILDDGRVTVDDFYQTMVSDIGVRVQQAESLRDNQEEVARSLENRRDEVAGVSIDEQIGQLILQQQAYTAAARIINIARENITTLMDIFR